MQAQAVTRETPFFIVLNTRSGAGKARECQAQMQEILQAAGQPHEFLFIEDTPQIEAIASKAARSAAERNGAVIVGGGDGTINAVAHAVLETRRPFGVIPQGTFNYLARTYSIPTDTAEAIRALLNARLRRVQVGALNDRIFLVNASLGLYPQLLQDREAYTRQYGRKRVVAIWAGITTLMNGYRQLVLDIEHDDGRETLRTPTLFVGNSPLQLERVGLPEAEDVQEHRLAAVMVRPVGSGILLWLALRGALGQLGEDRNVRNFSFQRLSVGRVGGERRLITVATDGELLRMRPPLNFSIAPHPLMLMVSAEAKPES